MNVLFRNGPKGRIRRCGSTGRFETGSSLVKYSGWYGVFFGGIGDEVSPRTSPCFPNRIVPPGTVVPVGDRSAKKPG